MPIPTPEVPGRDPDRDRYHALHGHTGEFPILPGNSNPSSSDMPPEPHDQLRLFRPCELEMPASILAAVTHGIVDLLVLRRQPKNPDHAEYEAWHFAALLEEISDGLNPQGGSPHLPAHQSFDGLATSASSAVQNNFLEALAQHTAGVSEQERREVFHDVRLIAGALRSLFDTAYLKTRADTENGEILASLVSRQWPPRG